MCSPCSDAAVNAAYMYAKSEAAFAPYGGTAAVFAKIVSGERSFLGKNEAHMLINRDMDIAAEIKAVRLCPLELALLTSDVSVDSCTYVTCAAVCAQELSLIKGDDSQATQKSIRVKFNKLVTIMRIALRKHMIASKNAITIKRQASPPPPCCFGMQAQPSTLLSGMRGHPGLTVSVVVVGCDWHGPVHVGQRGFHRP